MFLKYGENKAKRAKNCIFMRLKALQNKGFSEIWSQLRFLRWSKVIVYIFKMDVYNSLKWLILDVGGKPYFIRV